MVAAKTQMYNLTKKIEKGKKRKLMYCAICEDEEEGFENIPDLRNHVRDSHKEIK